MELNGECLLVVQLLAVHMPDIIVYLVVHIFSRKIELLYLIAVDCDIVSHTVYLGT